MCAVAIGGAFQSCKKFYDVNTDPNNLTDAPIPQLLPAITVNVGYMGASDLYRYTGLIAQQFSGNTTNTSQTFREYERYSINNSDVNNPWNNIFNVTLADVAKLITKAEAEGSPHYAGVAKLLKCYVYQVTVDSWGDVPYSEASKFADNLTPKYDDDEAIYKDLITTIDAAIVNLNAPASVLEPNSNTTIYASSSWTDSKLKWIKFANTLKLRLYLHYSQKDPAFATAQMTALINSGAQFMTATTDNFQMPFLAESGRQNPNASVEGGQFRNAFFPNRTIVNIMNGKSDPRRDPYYLPFPYNSNPKTYKGASALDPFSIAYSRLNTFLKGSSTINTAFSMNPDGSITDGSISWSGNAPTRLLTFAEYNFIRAEAALMGAPGDAQVFFEAGIRASMTDAGVATADANAYVLANGTLTGTNTQKLEKIITEKFVANFGVLVEPWTDWRRTGYPSAIVPLPISVAAYATIPRTIIYPLGESNTNPNTPKRTDLSQRVFWDTRP
jgi:hypothetical protein